MKFVKLFLILFLPLHLNSCLTAGRNYNEDKLKNIVLNVTTKKDVLTLLGEPSSIGITDKEIIFKYFSYRIIFFFPKTKDLNIVFNIDNTVKEYSFISHNEIQNF